MSTQEWACDVLTWLLMWRQVFGGTVNCGDGALTVRATAVAADSTVARMARLVEEVCSVLLGHMKRSIPSLKGRSLSFNAGRGC